jgi:uncharacterized coiled-coil protein SlyX
MFAMNIPEIIAKLCGVTERLEAVSAQNATAQADLTNARARIAELESQLAACDGIEDLRAQVVALTSEREGLATQVTAITGELATAKADLDSEKAQQPIRINAEVARLLAESGHPPIVLPVDNNPDPKSDKPKLTGLAKTLAAFKAASAAKK